MSTVVDKFLHVKMFSMKYIEPLLVNRFLNVITNETMILLCPELYPVGIPTDVKPKLINLSSSFVFGSLTKNQPNLSNSRLLDPHYFQDA